MKKFNLDRAIDHEAISVKKSINMKKAHILRFGTLVLEKEEFKILEEEAALQRKGT